MSKYSFGTSVRIRLLRLRRTQRQLAQALGYSPSYLSMYLSGQLQNPMLRRRIQEILDQWEAD